MDGFGDVVGVGGGGGELVIWLKFVVGVFIFGVGGFLGCGCVRFLMLWCVFSDNFLLKMVFFFLEKFIGGL